MKKATKAIACALLALVFCGADEAAAAGKKKTPKKKPAKAQVAAPKDEPAAPAKEEPAAATTAATPAATPSPAAPVATSPAPAPGPAPATAPPPSASVSAAASNGADSVAGEDDHGAAYSTVDIAAFCNLRSRRFAYSDGRSSNLRPYDVDGVPSVGARLDVFPLARSSARLARGLGLTADAQSAPSFDSTMSDGARLRTAWTRFGAALRYSIALASSPRAAAIGVSAGYGREALRFSERPIDTGNQLPEVRYDFGRAALDARVPIGPVTARAEAAYLHVFDMAGLASRFREASARGVEGRLGVGVPFARVPGVGRVEGRVSGTYTRFFYDFTPVPGDRFVAGGALDEMFGGELGLAFAID